MRKLCDSFIGMLYHLFCRVVFLILPPLELLISKIKMNHSDFEQNYVGIDWEHFNKFDKDIFKRELDRTLQIKSSLETKAQNSAFSVAIVITLIFSLLSFFNEVLFKDEFNYNLKLLTIILSCCVVAYFIFGEILNLFLLTNKIQHYFYTLEDECFSFNSDIDKKKYIYEDLILKNRRLNVERNNILSCATACIRNGIVLMATIFMIFIIAIAFVM